MNPMIVQAIAGALIILLGIGIFKTYPLKADGRELIFGALFLLIALIVNMFSIRLPLFGFDSLRIGFAQIMLICGAVLIRPSWAFLMGLSYDFLGLLVNPTSFPFLGFTLGNILVCVLPSLWYHSKRTRKYTDYNLMLAVDAVLVLLCVLSLIFIGLTHEVKINTSQVAFTLWMKLGTAGICVSVSAVLIVALHFIKKHFSSEHLHELTNMMMVVLIVEICIQFGCTPIWMQVMYGIPWAASLFLRIVKACVMIPLNVLIGYNILRAVRKMMRR